MNGIFDKAIASGQEYNNKSYCIRRERGINRHDWAYKLNKSWYNRY